MSTVINGKSIPLTNHESPLAQFRWSHAMLTELCGATDNLRIDIRSLDPGRFSYPYHYHRNAQELFYIIEGQATLRTPDGFQVVNAGDVVFHEKGASSVHQVYNHTDAPCRFLDLYIPSGVDVCVYPDTGKLMVIPYFEMFDDSGRTEYWSGEENVKDHWPTEIVGPK